MKLDVKKSLDSYRAVHGEFRTLEIAPTTYLMLDGHGDPNTAPEYAEAIGALYPVAYATKFHSKLELDRDYVVPPLEALWWADDVRASTSRRDKAQWHWTVMIMTPDWIAADVVDAGVAKSRAKGGSPALDLIRLELLEEATCVQTLHLGPYDDEAAVLARLHDDHLPGAGWQPSGKHHEIYLNDARRVAPARLRTILRQPVVARS